MSLSRPTKFLAPLRSVFDFGGQQDIVKAVNALLNGTIRSDTGRNRVSAADGRVTWEVNVPAVEQMFPFKIYNIKNNTATPDQLAQFNQGASIDQLTFQIRGGYVGARSYLNLPQVGVVSEEGSELAAYGNWEQQLFCPATDSQPNSDVTANGIDPFYYQPVSNSGQCVVLDNTQPTLIYGITKGSPAFTPVTSYAQVALNPTPDGFPDIPSTLNWSAAFWIEIVDDPLNGIYLNLMAQMYADQIADPRSETKFPSGPNIVPLGLAGYAFYFLTETNVNFIRQLQSGNLLNRFRPNSNTQRGLWSQIFAALPAGNTNLVFYPGDIVIDDTTVVAIGGSNFYLAWQYVGTNFGWYNINQVPSAGNWQNIGIIPQ